MIHDFYHNTREEIKELDARITNYDTRMQDSESKHRTEIISHMQKVKHLEFEHVDACGTVKSEALDDMKLERKHHTDTEKSNLESKAERKETYLVNDKANIAEIEEREEELKRKVRDLQEQLDFSKSSLIENYEMKLQRLEAELELRMKVEIHEIEERKN